MQEFSPDGKRLFVLTSDQTTYILDVSLYTRTNLTSPLSTPVGASIQPHNQGETVSAESVSGTPVTPFPVSPSTPLPPPREQRFCILIYNYHMARAAANTGIMPMALVAVEQYFPKAQRVIDDGLAARLLPLAGRIFVRLLRPLWMRNWFIGLSEKSNPGIWGGLLCRKRYIDEKIADSRNEKSPKSSKGISTGDRGVFSGCPNPYCKFFCMQRLTPDSGTTPQGRPRQPLLFYPSNP